MTKQVDILSSSETKTTTNKVVEGQTTKESPSLFDSLMAKAKEKADIKETNVEKVDNKSSEEKVVNTNDNKSLKKSEKDDSLITKKTEKVQNSNNSKIEKTNSVDETNTNKIAKNKNEEINNSENKQSKESDNKEVKNKNSGSLLDRLVLEAKNKIKTTTQEELETKLNSKSKESKEVNDNKKNSIPSLTISKDSKNDNNLEKVKPDSIKKESPLIIDSKTENENIENINNSKTENKENKKDSILNTKSDTLNSTNTQIDSADVKNEIKSENTIISSSEKKEEVNNKKTSVLNSTSNDLNTNVKKNKIIEKTNNVSSLEDNSKNDKKELVEEKNSSTKNEVITNKISKDTKNIEKDDSSNVNTEIHTKENINSSTIENKNVKDVKSKISEKVESSFVNKEEVKDLSEPKVSNLSKLEEKDISKKTNNTKIEQNIVSTSATKTEVKNEKVAKELASISKENKNETINISKEDLVSSNNSIKKEENKSLMDKLIEKNQNEIKKQTLDKEEKGIDSKSVESILPESKKTKTNNSSDFISNMYLSSQKNTINKQSLANKKEAQETLKEGKSTASVEKSAKILDLGLEKVNVEVKTNEIKKDEINHLDKKSSLDRLAFNKNVRTEENNTLITKSIEASKVVLEDNTIKTTNEVSVNVNHPLSQNIQSKIIGARQSMSTMMSDVAKQMYENYKPPVTAFKINLNPGTLGGIAIVLKSDKDNAISISMNISNSSTLDAFVENQNSLKSALNKTFDEDTQFNLDFSSNDNNEQSSNNKDDENGDKSFGQNKGNTQAILNARENNQEVEDKNLDYM